MWVVFLCCCYTSNLDLQYLDEVHKSINKASVDISRGRVAELIDMQRQQHFDRKPSNSDVSVKISGTDMPPDSTYVSNDTGYKVNGAASLQRYDECGDSLESEISALARRIRDRLMMPNAVPADR